jgi:elongation factor Ts
VKELREKTGAGVMECRRTLEEAGGDVRRAEEILRERGEAQAAKKAGREASQGVIDCYIHGGGRIGVLVEVNCESDFVARNEDFRAMAHDIAMQIAAMNPQYISPEEVPADVEGDREQLALLSQSFIKSPDRTIRDLITEKIAKLGENIRVRRFVRYEVGEG